MQLIGENVLISDQAINYLRNFLETNTYSKVFVLTEERVAEQVSGKLTGFDYNLICVQPGEANKNLATSGLVWEQLLKGQADRHSVLINFGGGMIGDLGGFCASTYQRGIEFIHVPTTLLAMVDASVGGKTGIDFMNLKNMIGLFAQPTMVFIQPNLLETLSNREFMAGYAEMLKHGLIADADYWNELKTVNKRRLKLQIERSVQIKMEVVEEDPHEQGTRKLLNFGHTIGHAIESHCLNENMDVLHGEAVAAGMWMEAFISQKIGLSGEQFNEIKNTISELYQPLAITTEMAPIVWELMLADKKNRAGVVNCTLLQEIGYGVFDIPITYQEFASALEGYLVV